MTTSAPASPGSPALVPSPRIRTSPFYPATLAAGANRFTVYNRMLMPVSYGDPAAEYRRLIETAALWDVACERQVEVAGPDAGRLVQYLTARDLGSLEVGEARYVAMCNHDGVLLNDPVLLRLSDRYWFSLADADMLLWVEAVAGERGFDARVCEPDVSPLAIQGPRGMDVAAALFGEGIRELARFHLVETDYEAIPVVVCRSGWSRQGGVEVFLRDGSGGPALWEAAMGAGQPYGIGPGAPNPVERVESGLLSFGGDTTPGSNPFEANMARYVDLDAPVDYIGKAALRRIATEGPRRLLVGLFLEAGISDTASLETRVPVWRDGEAVGTMSAAVHSPRLGRTIAIAQIERAVVEAGAPLEVDGRSGRVAATITGLPFI